MKTVWKNKAVIDSGVKCKINGLNIWDYEWTSTGENITVKDPLYGKSFQFAIYEIQGDNVRIKFAAGEFSNSIFGIYVEKKTWF